MMDISIYSVVAIIATLLGLIAGRVFALEGGRNFTSALAATYVGAGVGLLSSILIGPPLTLVAQYTNVGGSMWFDALSIAGTALLWGTGAGAVGGLAIGIVIALLPSKWLWESPAKPRIAQGRVLYD